MTTLEPLITCVRAVSPHPLDGTVVVKVSASGATAGSTPWRLARLQRLVTRGSIPCTHGTMPVTSYSHDDKSSYHGALSYGHPNATMLHQCRTQPLLGRHLPHP
eukprot:7893910-Pyramimonas_sp.AAC.1